MSWVRAYGAEWVFDVDLRGSAAESWSEASATVRRGPEWRIADLGPASSSGRAVLKVLRAGWPTPPESVFLNMKTKGLPSTAATFVFDREP